MSRAEDRDLPPPPRLGGSLRGAVTDFYENAWRFLVANVIFGVSLVAVAIGTVGTVWALLLVPVCALPAAGMMRMATFLVRDGRTGFGIFASTIRRPLPVLAVGAVQALVGVVLVIDIQVGATIGGFIGLLLGVSAIYGLLIGWAYAATAWTILLDPERDAMPIRARLRLAAVVLVAHPVRVGGYVLGVGLLLGLSALAIAPVLTFTVALAWLALAHFVLPVADRIEGRLTRVVDESA